jgi:hypothetical protein
VTVSPPARERLPIMLAVSGVLAHVAAALLGWPHLAAAFTGTPADAPGLLAVLPAVITFFVGAGLHASAIASVRSHPDPDGITRLANGLAWAGLGVTVALACWLAFAA